MTLIPNAPRGSSPPEFHFISFHSIPLVFRMPEVEIAIIIGITAINLMT